MENDAVTQDAATLLAALVRNHPDAARGAAFALTEDEARRTGLNQDRFDHALWWLIEYGFVERDEEAENLLGNVKGLTEYEYGLAFRITKRGRELLPRVEADGPT